MKEEKANVFFFLHSHFLHSEGLGLYSTDRVHMSFLNHVLYELQRRQMGRRVYLWYRLCMSFYQCRLENTM